MGHAVRLKLPRQSFKEPEEEIARLLRAYLCGKLVDFVMILRIYALHYTQLGKLAVHAIRARKVQSPSLEGLRDVAGKKLLGTPNAKSASRRHVQR